MSDVHLVVVDPQIDFCAPPGYLATYPQGGSLYVPGAEGDMARLAAMVRRVKPGLSAIHVTMDWHHSAQVFHPMWWTSAQGRHPAPFTTVTVADVESGAWTTTNPAYRQRGLDYVRALEAGGRYALTVWPYHCLIGSQGAAVMPDLFGALSEWERDRLDTVFYKTKGGNPFTEHYSPLRAEVPDPQDPATQLDTGWLATLRQADVLLMAGEALSHCFLNFVRDVAEAFKDKSLVQKMVLLRDATSPIPGFEPQVDAFLADMAARGMQTTTTADFTV